MEYETAKIAKVTGKCPACEDYAERNSTSPPKIAVMACEGACARGEVARRAANLVAHRFATGSTVRICLGGAFTKDTGQRNLIRRADRVIAIEGCFINCSSRMMQGVLPDLEPEIVRADLIYNLDLPFGIDEVPDEMFTIYANQVAESVVKGTLAGKSPKSSPSISCGTGPSPTTGCQAPPVSCGTGMPSCGTGPTSCCPNMNAGSPGPMSCSSGPATGKPTDIATVSLTQNAGISTVNQRGGSLAIGQGPVAFTPTETLMAALGSCVNAAIIGQLKNLGKSPDRLETQVTGTRKTTLPAGYEKIHLTFTISVGVSDAELEGIFRQAITVLCPVAVTLGKATDLTWEYRRTNGN